MRNSSFGHSVGPQIRCGYALVDFFVFSPSIFFNLNRYNSSLGIFSATSLSKFYRTTPNKSNSPSLDYVTTMNYQRTFFGRQWWILSCSTAVNWPIWTSSFVPSHPVNFQIIRTTDLHQWKRKRIATKSNREKTKQKECIKGSWARLCVQKFECLANIFPPFRPKSS